MKTLLLCNCLLLFLRVHSQSAAPSDAPAIYLTTTTYSGWHPDAFAFLGNPAVLANTGSAAAGAFTQRRFLLKELTDINLVGQIPLRSGGAGLSVHHEGLAIFQRLTIAAAYAHRMGPDISAGLQFHYSSIRIAGYENTKSIGADLAFLFRLTSRLRAGIVVTNLISNRSRAIATSFPGSQKPAALFSAGMGYDAGDHFFIFWNLQKESGFVATCQVGLHYQAMRQLFARIGVTNNGSSLYVASGLSFGRFRMDVSVSFHQALGMTPGFSFQTTNARQTAVNTEK